jgi:hypothetical protein
LRNIDNGPEGLNQIEKNDRAKVAEEIQQMWRWRKVNKCWVSSMNVEESRRTLRKIEIGVAEGHVRNRGNGVNRKIEAEIKRTQMWIEATTDSMLVDGRLNWPFELKLCSKSRSARVDQRRQKGLREDRRFGSHFGCTSEI